MEHNLYKNIGDVDVCTEFEMLKVKVLYLFFFSAQWVSRYLGRDVTSNTNINLIPETEIPKSKLKILPKLH
jgi:hypothetical protein